MSWIPPVGLLIGIVLRVLIPYARESLQAVAKTGTWKSWYPFDWRYLAMVLIPVMEYGVAFLTVQGLWETMFTWEFVPAVALSYTGTDLGKELVQGAAAIYSMVRK
jgi:hypothetical protein